MSECTLVVSVLLPGHERDREARVNRALAVVVRKVLLFRRDNEGGQGGRGSRGRRTAVERYASTSALSRTGSAAAAS